MAGAELGPGRLFDREVERSSSRRSAKVCEPRGSVRGLQAPEVVKKIVAGEP